MPQLIEFVTQHWALWLTLVVLVVALIYIEIQTKILGARGVTARELIGLLNDNKVLVVDLRDKETYLTGHILGSVNIALQEFNSDFNASAKRLEEYKEKRIVFVDNGIAGTQVYALIKKLKALNYKDLDVLTGGVLAWKEASLPLTRK